MIRIIIYALIAYLLYRALKALFLPKINTTDQRNGKIIDEMIQDPFCEKYVPRREAIKRTINGEDYFFCSESCADQFEAKNMKD
jgi:YHS domain-containing protein